MIRLKTKDGVVLVIEKLVTSPLLDTMEAFVAEARIQGKNLRPLLKQIV